MHLGIVPVNVISGHHTFVDGGLRLNRPHDLTSLMEAVGSDSLIHEDVAKSFASRNQLDNLRF